MKKKRIILELFDDLKMQPNSDNKENKKDTEFKQTVFALICILAIIIILGINAIILKSNKSISDKDYLATLPKTYLWNETTVRFIPNQDAIVGCSNPEYRWNVRINNDGFRGQDISEEGEIIGVFGDSHAYGFCLKENETLSSLMNLELSQRDIHLNTVNFGFPGYGLESMLNILAYATNKYNLKYAIIYFTPGDDLIECDQSCRTILKMKNETASEKIEKNLANYVAKETQKYPDNLKSFEPRIMKKLIENNVIKKTKVIFYVDMKKPEILEILDRNNITHIEPYDISENIETIPFDGHPSGGFNKLLAKEIVNEIESLENQEVTR